MGYHNDEIVAVLQAAERVVDGLSDAARARLRDGAMFVRLERDAALELLTAVDDLRDETPAQT